MNKTKRKIFESSMKLFAQKGYDGTSIEDITADVGVAKGTLYYHFTSKEEIFNFLIDEGMNLLKNSITIKTDKEENYINKLKAVILIQIKIINKYENFMSIVMSEVWGESQRSRKCKDSIDEYLKIVEAIIKKGMEKNEIRKADPQMLARQIFGLTCTCLYYKKAEKDFSVEKIYKELEKNYIQLLKI